MSCLCVITHIHYPLLSALSIHRVSHLSPPDLLPLNILPLGGQSRQDRIIVLVHHIMAPLLQLVRPAMPQLSFKFQTRSQGKSQDYQKSTSHKAHHDFSPKNYLQTTSHSLC